MADGELVLRLLGPVRVRRDGMNRPLGAGLRPAVLAVLALAGEATRDQLIAAVWGDDPPPSAGSNVYTHVNALRKTLGGKVLTRENGAYQLRVTEQTVDARWFEALRQQARQHRASGRRPAELAALDQALSLWDGEALAGVPGPYADAQRARLRELRIASEQRRAELLLEVGPAAAVVAESWSPQTRDIVRAVVFLGPGATATEVSAVTGLPTSVIEAATDYLLTSASGTVTLRDPELGRALYGRTPETVRAARHEFFAKLIAEAFGPAERVAAQLLRAGPAPLSPPASRWLLEHIDELVHRSPDAAVALLRRAHLRHQQDSEVHVALTAWLARLLFGQGRDAFAESGWVAARTGHPELQAEMLWIAACSHDRQDRPVAAADIARAALGRRQHAQRWLDRFRELVLRVRLRLPGVPTEPHHGRADVVSDTKLSAYRNSIAPDGAR